MTTPIRISAWKRNGIVRGAGRPSIMMSAGTTAESEELFDAIPGPRGLLRMTLDFITPGTTDLDDYLNKLRDHVTVSLIAERAIHGTVLVGIGRMPSWLSSSNSAISTGEGSLAYQTARPDDFDDWEEFIRETTAVFRAKGIPPARDHAGSVRIGGPGVIWGLWNEPNSRGSWGFHGLATLLDFCELWRRFFIGAKAGDPSAVVTGPAAAAWNVGRTDYLPVTWSADVLSSFGTFAGGAEATGRRDAAGTRSIFKCDPSRTGPFEISSLALKTLHGSSPVGTVSSDTFRFHPYNGDGQGDPDLEATHLARFDRAIGGTAYVSNDTTWRTTGGKSIALGAQAVTDFVAARTAESAYSVGCSMNGDSSGADRYVLPVGLGDATLTNNPVFEVVYSKALLENWFEFCRENDCEPEGIDFHNFGLIPADIWEDAVAGIRGYLENAGLSPGIQLFVTEFQIWTTFPAFEDPIRDTEEGAAYILNAIAAARRAGVSALCQATLRDFNDGTPNATLNQFHGDFGIVTRPNEIQKPSFSVHEFLGYMAEDGFEEIAVEQTAAMATKGIDAIASMGRDRIALALGRFGGSGGETIRLEVEGFPVRGYWVHRTNSTRNNTKAAFDAAVGDGGAAAVAAALAAQGLHFELVRSRILELTLEANEVVFAIGMHRMRPRDHVEPQENYR